MTISIGLKISVCLLTYNHAQVIESTLNSILDQSIADYEVVISDDCSTDGTWERVLELAKTDDRIKPIRTPRNLGMPGNANYAAARTNRPYIALLHHDDLYRNDLLEKWAGVLERHQGAAFVFNPYGVFQSELVYREEMPAECIDGHWLLENYLLPRWGCVVRGTAMIRRKAWEQAGGMREQFGLLADVDLWMRLAMCWQVGYVPEPVITVRHQRPSDYPDEYKENNWSWRRQRFLYEIHAANRVAYWDVNTLKGRLKWWWFRLKLSGETAKWLAYAVVRKKPAMITTSEESATEYDLFPLRLLRLTLQRVKRI
ncbi:MAG: glycosyltransferase family 2 protein [Burkholderiaceae bacterium]